MATCEVKFYSIFKFFHPPFFVKDRKGPSENACERCI